MYIFIIWLSGHWLVNSDNPTSYLLTILNAWHPLITSSICWLSIKLVPPISGSFDTSIWKVQWYLNSSKNDE